MEPNKLTYLRDIDKDLDTSTVEIPSKTNQKYYHVHGKFVPKERFVSIISRKGHKNPNYITIMLNSKTSSEPMFRFDVIGAPHNGNPTPHLHIFDKDQDYTNPKFVSKDNLPSELKSCLDNLDKVDLIFESFLRYIHVDLNDVQMTVTII